ncbi:MAG: PucR family transcriptional regulator [Gammaproteobacteria bacterium]|nr:PucR family transcriptional regulator [Gammaproteobacteria bacterium]
MSNWIHDAAIAANPRSREKIASAVAEFSIQYANTVSIVSAAEYVAHTRVLAEAEGDHRTELLSILVSGYDESDGRVARLLKRAGYLEQRKSFCVALAQSTDPLEMESPARAQRIVEAMTQAVASIPVRALVGIRSNVVTAVFSDVRRVSGWTAPQANLADRIRPRLLVLGPSVLIGMSSDQPSTSFIPRGLHEATVALDFADVTQRVVQFSELPIRRLLIHRGADYVQSAMPVWFPSFRDADAKSQGALVKTLRALADADMNVQRAARELHVHPNTIYARIDRISALTGLEAQRYHHLTDLLLAADCGRA